MFIISPAYYRFCLIINLTECIDFSSAVSKKLTYPASTLIRHRKVEKQRETERLRDPDSRQNGE